MSDEYESANVDESANIDESAHVDGDNVYYSPFWPLTIVLAGFILWLGYQILVLNQSRNAVNAELEQAMPTLQQAEMAQNRLVSLLKDLDETSQKDPYAKQIMKEVIQAGLVHVNSNPNAAPPATLDSSNDSTDASGK